MSLDYDNVLTAAKALLEHGRSYEMSIAFAWMHDKEAAKLDEKEGDMWRAAEKWLELSQNLRKALEAVSAPQE